MLDTLCVWNHAEMCLKMKTCCMLSSNLFGVEKGQGAWCFVGEVFPKHGSSFLEQIKLRRNNQNHVELWLLELCACHSWSFMIYVSNPFDSWRFWWPHRDLSASHCFFIRQLRRPAWSVWVTWGKRTPKLPNVRHERRWACSRWGDGWNEWLGMS